MNNHIFDQVMSWQEETFGTPNPDGIRNHLLRAKIAEKGLNVLVKTRYPRKFFKTKQDYLAYAEEKYPILNEFVSTLGLKINV